MKSPFQPAPGTAGSHQLPEPIVPVEMHQENAQGNSEPRLPNSGPSLGGSLEGEAPIRVKKVRKRVKKTEKQGFFAKLFGGGKPTGDLPEPPEAEEAPKTEIPFDLPQKPTDGELMIKRHEELLQSVDDICKSLEATRPQQVEVSLTDVLPPIPAENFNELADTQIQVTGALEKVADRLDEAGRRDGEMMDTLSRFDGTLSELSRTNERSVSAIDGMKGVFAQVSGSMESVQTEMKKTSHRYEELCESIQKSDDERAKVIVQLQKRTLMVTSLLGIAVLIGLLLVAFSR